MYAKMPLLGARTRLALRAAVKTAERRLERRLNKDRPESSDTSDTSAEERLLARLDPDSAAR